MKKRLNPGKTVLTIFILNFIQVAVIAAILLYLDESVGRLDILSSPGIILLLTVALAAIILNSFSALRSRSALLREGTKSNLLAVTLSRLEVLNTTLRSQRHDFMNHLQVVYSLMEMDEYKDAKDYIEKVYQDIQKVSRVMKTSNPAVNALLQAKLISCEKHGITAVLEVSTQLKDLKIPSWEYCRIIGNIIDNSIYALLEKGQDMQLKLELSNDLKYHYFKVSNNGPSIPPAIAGRIFEPGFTTKGDKGEGMGLSISKEIAEQYGGNIKVNSNTDWTVFEVMLPRGAEPAADEPSTKDNSSAQSISVELLSAESEPAGAISARPKSEAPSPAESMYNKPDQV